MHHLLIDSYKTIHVTVTFAERSFSKLKQILQSCLSSTMSHERLIGLAMFLIGEKKPHLKKQEKEILNSKYQL